MIDFRFYLVTDRAMCAPRSLVAVVREACDAGVRAVQLRERDLAPSEVEEFIRRVLEVTRPRGARLVVNRSRGVRDETDAFLAASLGVDGFHVPDGAPYPSEVRRRFPRLLIGVSAHSEDAVRAAAWARVDFVSFGPVFATASKERFGPPLGLDALSKACAAAAVPVFAIGGVTPENTRECIEAGAHGVAAIGAVMGAEDVTAAIAAFAAALGGRL